MSIATLIRDMAAAGATPEAIAIAVDAIEAVNAREAERKAKRAKQKAEERARKAATVARQSHDKGATVGDTPAPNDVLPNLDTSEVSLNPTPYSPPPVENSDLGFGRLWDVYPRRSGTNSRKNAETRFRAAVKSGCDPETIIDGARRYAAHCDATGKTGTEFVKAAEAWLNGRLWECSYSLTVPRPPPPRQARRNTALEGLDELERRFTNVQHQPNLRIAG